MKQAKTLIQRDSYLQSFIDVVRNKVQNRTNTNENLRRRLMNINNRQYLVPRNGDELLYDMEHYNLDGRYMQVLIIGGGNLYQGLDIQALKALHIVDVMHTPKQYEQIVGRASRGFGHHDLPVRERNVTIYHYKSAIPNVTSITKDPSGMNLFKSTSQNAKTTLYSRIQQEVAVRFGLQEVSGRRVNKAVVDMKQAMALEACAGMRFIQHHKKAIFNTTNSLGVNQLLETHRQKEPTIKKFQNTKTALRTAAIEMNGFTIGSRVLRDQFRKARATRDQSRRRRRNTTRGSPDTRKTRVLRRQSGGVRK